MKQNYKLFSILVIICLLFTPCLVWAEPENTDPDNTTPSTPGETPTVTEITLSLDKTEANLDVGKSLTLVATTNQENAIIEWSSSNENVATVDDNGKVTANNLAGSTTITASIKDTDIKATCTIKVLRVVSKDATLKSLTIINDTGTLDQTFKSDQTNYNITIGKNVSKIEFDYELNDEHATFFGPSNNKNLKNGDKLEFKIVAEDGETSKIYTLTVVKDTTSLALSSLKINGYALNETFKSNDLKYTANIPYEIETLTVYAKPEDDNAKVVISGITNLKVGENTIKAVVTDEDGNSRTYEIIVTREKKVTIDENPTSIITSSDTTSDGATTDNINNNGNSNTKKDNSDDGFLKYAIVSLACLILFAIGGIGIYFYIKTSPKKLRKELGGSKKTSEELPVTIDDDKSLGNISEIINEDLFATREYKKEELSDKDKPSENLFDDNSEDVK